MNKYQEAFDDIISASKRDDLYMGDSAYDLIDKDSIKLIQELVDKATPKKPPKHDRVVCPTRNSKANYGHPYTEYCCHCGQALDWSKDE